MRSLKLFPGVGVGEGVGEAVWFGQEVSCSKMLLSNITGPEYTQLEISASLEHVFYLSWAGLW